MTNRIYPRTVNKVIIDMVAIENFHSDDFNLTTRNPWNVAT